jgi:L(+)-tartrate dehydratase beta subunit
VLVTNEYDKITPGIVRHDTGTKPATPRRYGETNDKTEEVI